MPLPKIAIKDKADPNFVPEQVEGYKTRYNENTGWKYIKQKTDSEKETLRKRLEDARRAKDAEKNETKEARDKALKLFEEFVEKITVEGK